MASSAGGTSKGPSDAAVVKDALGRMAAKADSEPSRTSTCSGSGPVQQESNAGTDICKPESLHCDKEQKVAHGPDETFEGTVTATETSNASSGSKPASAAQGDGPVASQHTPPSTGLIGGARAARYKPKSRNHKARSSPLRNVVVAASDVIKNLDDKREGKEKESERERGEKALGDAQPLPTWSARAGRLQVKVKERPAATCATETSADVCASTTVQASNTKTDPEEIASHAQKDASGSTQQKNADTNAAPSVSTPLRSSRPRNAKHNRMIRSPTVPRTPLTNVKLVHPNVQSPRSGRGSPAYRRGKGRAKGRGKGRSDESQVTPRRVRLIVSS